MQKKKDSKATATKQARKTPKRTHENAQQTQNSNTQLTAYDKQLP